MSGSSPPGLTEYVAQVTAGATHELRNVFAIVRESAGLIGDLAGSGSGESAAAAARALGRIEQHVGRGVALVAAVNRLAHGLEGGRQPIQLGELLEDARVLCERVVRQRERRLEVRCEGQGMVVGGWLELQRLLWLAVHAGLESVPEGGTLELRVAGARLVRVETGGRLSTAGPGWSGLEEAVLRADCRLETGGSPGGFGILFGE